MYAQSSQTGQAFHLEELGEAAVTTWTLEKAKNQLSEVVRRALAHEPQLVTRGRHDAVIVVARDDYERLVVPQPLVEFMRDSPPRRTGDGSISRSAGKRATSG